MTKFVIMFYCSDVYCIILIASLEDLRQKINSGVGKIDSEENEVAIGSFCVAKFSEDDK